MKKKFVDWERMRMNKCPKCRGDLEADQRTTDIVCKNQDFRIGHERYKEIVARMNAEAADKARRREEQPQGEGWGRFQEEKRA